MNNKKEFQDINFYICNYLKRKYYIKKRTYQINKIIHY